MDAAFNEDVVVISGLIFGFSLYFSLLPENLSWRPVRSGLRPQPARPVSGDFRLNVAWKPAVGGLLALGGESLRTQFENSSVHCAENLCASSALFPFSGESSRRFGSIRLRDRVGGTDQANFRLLMRRRTVHRLTILGQRVARCAT